MNVRYMTNGALLEELLMTENYRATNLGDVTPIGEIRYEALKKEVLRRMNPKYNS